MISFTNDGTITATNGISTNGSGMISGDIVNNGIITRGSQNGDVISGNVANIKNYGTIIGGINITTDSNPGIHNHGTMGGIKFNKSNGSSYAYDLALDNRGTINLYNSNSSGRLAHLEGSSGTKLALWGYSIKIDENQSAFNSFSGYTDNNNLNKTAHFVMKNIEWSNVTVGSSAKIYIDIDLSKFELGKTYSINKIITKEDGSGLLPTSYFNILALKQEGIYSLSRQGDYFVIDRLENVRTPITALYKSNIKVMNNMFLNSNAIIFRQKQQRATMRQNTRTPTQRRVIRRSAIESNFGDSQDFIALDMESSGLYALNELNINEHFFNNLRYSSVRRATKTSANQNFYFNFAPFLNHNYFYEDGSYNLSGLDGGFITNFGANLGLGNTLGVHFGFGYGHLSDKLDKEFVIKNANLMLGLNYKLDLIWNMYVKARGDFFYFINEVASSTVAKTKPNNMGFGISVAYGKDFDFKNYGVLGLELALDYKALSTTALSLKSALDAITLQDYNKSLHNLIYLDLGINYDKYFNTKSGVWGFNVGLGVRGNLAPKLSKGQITVYGRNINFLLDNDKILGYVNLGGSYVLNMPRYMMEFGLTFNGNYGDRTMSNGGSFEWKVLW